MQRGAGGVRNLVFSHPQVVEGMDVVYKVEAQGSQTGTPRAKVVISDSGVVSDAAAE